MRVLMTTDTSGSVWNYTLELARSLRPLGIEIVLAAMGQPLSAEQKTSLRALPWIDVRARESRLGWTDKPWHDAQDAGDWLLRADQETKPDLVHLNQFCFAHLPWLKPKLVVPHSEVTTWWSAARGGAAPAEWDEYRWRVTKGLRSADLVVAPTRSMLRELAALYGPFRASEVIPIGRDVERRATEKEPFVLSVGKLWDEARNTALLNTAAPDLEWPVIAIGELEAPHGARAYLPHVITPGTMNEEALANHYARASIYALPAHYDPFGLSVLEAATAGCALVLGDIPSLRENWDGAALFIDPADPGDLISALQDLIANRAIREELGVRARDRASLFTPTAMAAGYWREYRRMTAGRPHETQSELFLRQVF